MVAFSGVDLLLALPAAAATALLPLGRYLFHWQDIIAATETDAEIDKREVRSDGATFAAEHPDIDPKAAALVLAAVQGMFAETDAQSKSNEGKANTILGFLGGGISLVALFSGFRADAGTGGPLVLLVAAAAFVGALVFSILCTMSPRRRGFPEADALRDGVEAGDVCEGTATALLVRSWQARLGSLRVINVRKAQYIEITQQLFVAGTICVMLSFAQTVIRPPASDAKKTLVECVSGDKAKPILSIDRVTCTIAPEAVHAEKERPR